MLLVTSVALLSVMLPMATIGIDVQKSYNEGWNAYHAARAAAGEILYTGDPARLVNYPFLSFYLVAWLKPLFGNVLLIGRGLNAVAFGMTALLSAGIIRRLGGNRIEALFGAACTLGFQAIQGENWIGTDEPQMLAEALMLGGLLCYVGGRPTLLRLASCALLFAAGGFVKPIVIAIPLAVSVDLLSRDRRRFALWCVCATMALALFTGLSNEIAGGHFWQEIFAPRFYHWSRLPYHGKKLLIAFKWPMIASILYLSRRLPPAQAVLMRSFGAVALISGIAFSGGDGVARNVYLDFAVFLGLTSALALGQWRRMAQDGRWSALLATALPIFLSLPILERLPQSAGPLLNFSATMQAYRQQETDFAQAKAYLREQAGPILCENLLLCYEAGKPLLIDPFNARSQMLVGRFNEGAPIADIARHRFGVIELPSKIRPDPERSARIGPDLDNQMRFTEGTLDAINRYYVPTFRAKGAIFFMPRPKPGTEPTDGVP